MKKRVFMLSGPIGNLIGKIVQPAKAHRCPCCNSKTLRYQGCMEICPVCGWEDDPEASANVDAASYPNGITLRKARENYRKFGNSVEGSTFGRKPLPDEL